MLRFVLSHVLRVVAHQVRHLPDPKAVIGTGSGHYSTKARVLKVEDGTGPVPYRCVYRIDDTIGFAGANGTLLRDGQHVEIVLEGGLLRTAAAAWGQLTQVHFDAETDGRRGTPFASPGYVGVTFRLQPIVT